MSEPIRPAERWTDQTSLNYTDWAEQKIEWLESEIDRLQAKKGGRRERLRDEFAMAALQGALGNPGISEALKAETINDIAKHCYGMADAMLNARESSDE